LQKNVWRRFILECLLQFHKKMLKMAKNATFSFFNRKNILTFVSDIFKPSLDDEESLYTYFIDSCVVDGDGARGC